MGSRWLHGPARIDGWLAGHAPERRTVRESAGESQGLG